MDLEKVKTRARWLESQRSGQEGKLIRNFNRYSNNGARREDIWTLNTAPLAYVNPAIGTEGTQTQINVIKSCVDTIASKISQANVRPYFIPSDGDHDTTQVCEKLQDYFDIWLDEQHAYPKSVMCFRDAAVNYAGIMHVCGESKNIYRVPTWEYAIDPAEYHHGAVTNVGWQRKDYPLAGVSDRITNSKLKARLSDDFRVKGPFHTYWDLYNGYKYDFWGSDWQLVSDPIKIDYEQYGGLYRRPFVEIFYTKPMKGFYSTSLADDLYPLQKQIDEIVNRLDAATRNAILQMILVPKGSGLKASILENNVRAYDFTPGPDGGAPISIAPPAINQQFVEMLQMYINQAYSIAGVSQLSAQSKAPPSLDSGKALDTMEDIESDRFNVQLQQFTHFLVDVARVAIDVFPKSDNIIQKRKGEDKVTWGDVCKQRDIFSVQFSASSSLSKDPNERFNQIAMLSQMGLIDKPMMKQFAQLPDLQGVYTMINSSYDYNEKIIDTAIKTGKLDYDETSDLQELQDLTVKHINRMHAAGDRPLYIDRLKKLLEKVNAQIKIIQPMVNPPPPPPPPEPLKDSALDSGQIQNLSSILEKVTNGVLHPQSALPLLTASFPKLPPQVIQAMIQGAVNLPPAPTQAQNSDPGQPGPQGVPNAA